MAAACFATKMANLSRVKNVRRTDAIDARKVLGNARNTEVDVDVKWRIAIEVRKVEEIVDFVETTEEARNVNILAATRDNKKQDFAIYIAQIKRNEHTHKHTHTHTPLSSDRCYCDSSQPRMYKVSNTHVGSEYLCTTYPIKQSYVNERKKRTHLFSCILLDFIIQSGLQR